VEDESSGLNCSHTGPVGGYHTILPLEVHGAGYQQMSAISNARAVDEALAAGEGQGRLCLRIVQRTFDLEVFCYKMAQKLCHAAGRKYYFCNDFDVEMVASQDDGEVVLVAFVLVSAAVFTRRQQRGRAREELSSPYGSSMHRTQYQASFRFSWNVDTGACAVVDSDPLAEVGPAATSAGTCASSPPAATPWHPAKAAAGTMQRTWHVGPYEDRAPRRPRG